jgi:tRNA(Met) cytidine acetyltransferase
MVIVVYPHLTGRCKARRVTLQKTEWCFDRAQLIIKTFNTTYFWLGSAPTEITSISFNNILGQETDLLIINALLNFDANQFAGAEGTLKGGGLLILLTPQCINKNDFFYQYISKQLAQSCFVFFAQNNPIEFTPLAATIDKQTGMFKSYANCLFVWRAN